MENKHSVLLLVPLVSYRRVLGVWWEAAVVLLLTHSTKRSKGLGNGVLPVFHRKVSRRTVRYRKLRVPIYEKTRTDTDEQRDPPSITLSHTIYIEALRLNSQERIAVDTERNGKVPVSLW